MTEAARVPPTPPISERLRALAERLSESGLDWDAGALCVEGAEMIEAQGLVISDLEQDADARIAGVSEGASPTLRERHELAEQAWGFAFAALAPTRIMEPPPPEWYALFEGRAGGDR